MAHWNSRKMVTATSDDAQMNDSNSDIRPSPCLPIHVASCTEQVSHASSCEITSGKQLYFKFKLRFIVIRWVEPSFPLIHYWIYLGAHQTKKLFLLTTQCPALSEVDRWNIWLFDDEHTPGESTCTLLQLEYCDLSIISPIQVQYDAIPFKNGFQSKMTTGYFYFREFQSAGFGETRIYLCGVNLFLKMKKKDSCLQEIQHRCSYLSEVTYPISDRRITFGRELDIYTWLSPWCLSCSVFQL